MFISIRYKFLFVVGTLLVLAVTTFLYLATDLFNSDKRAYIYDNNAAFVDAMGEEVATGMQSVIKTMRLAALTFRQPGLDSLQRDMTIEQLLADEPAMVDLSIHDASTGGDLLFRHVNEGYLTALGRDGEYLDTVRRERPVDLSVAKEKKLLLQNASLPGGIPLISIAVAAGDDGGLIVNATVAQDRRLQIFNRSSVYSASLIDFYGNLISHRDPERSLQSENLSHLPVVSEIISSKLASGAREYTAPDGRDYIIGYKKLPGLRLIVLSELSSDQAFAASARLIEKSVLFALLILAVSFVVSILSTSRLTSSVQRLYAGTVRIAQGDFNVQVPVKTRDEVGSLTLSFNQMAGEVMRLMRETADKARMEKEIETAQLVQDNFFPQDRIDAGCLEISACFKPASECGGDWWGHLPLGDKTVVMIGDATGHGVGAALITAAIHSCASLLGWLQEQGSIRALTASSIMSALNAAVCRTGRQRVKMTFFVGIVDHSSGEVSYCNASHEMPFSCPSPAQPGQAGKRDIEALSGAPDPCLGQDLNAGFREHLFTLRPDHSLILFSDGLMEGCNHAGEEYGEGRLLRSIVKSAHLPADAMQESLISDAAGFRGEAKPMDDITLVVVRRKAVRDIVMKAV